MTAFFYFYVFSTERVFLTFGQKKWGLRSIPIPLNIKLKLPLQLLHCNYEIFRYGTITFLI